MVTCKNAVCYFLIMMKNVIWLIPTNQFYVCDTVTKTKTRTSFLLYRGKCNNWNDIHIEFYCGYLPIYSAGHIIL